MKIVAFVGADGTGKSTQARMLADRLSREGRRARCVRPVFLLFDPWRIRGNAPASHALSPRVRRVSGSSGTGTLRRRALPLNALVGYLYAVATYLYMRTVFWKEDYLVCDRYLYQYFYDLFGSAAVSVSTAFPVPDAVFWLDAGIELLESRSPLTMTEQEHRYYSAAISYYRSLAGRLPFVHIDAAADAHAVGDEVWSRLPMGTRRSNA